MAELTLMYGESGTYKSSNLAEAAEYIFETTGGVCLLASADSSWAPMQPQIDRGVIVPWNLNSCDYPLSSLMKISKGYWPDKLIDGVADEKSMKAPMPNSMYCTRRNPAKEGEYKIGGMLFEGLAMIGELLKSSLEEGKRSTGEPLVAQFEEQGESFAMGSRGTYQFVQNQTRKYVFNLKPLPCDRIIVTSHEGKGEDDNKRPIFGPAIVGKASTDKVPQWFETTLHFESYQQTVKRKDNKGAEHQVNTIGVRAYFDRHQDNELKTIFWPAKISAPPTIKAKILEQYPLNYFPLKIDKNGLYTEGLHTFLRLMDESAAI